MFSGIDGQLVIYHTAGGLASSCPLTVVSPVPQVNVFAHLCVVSDKCCVMF